MMLRVIGGAGGPIMPEVLLGVPFPIVGKGLTVLLLLLPVAEYCL